MDQAIRMHLRTIQRGVDGVETIEESSHTGSMQEAEGMVSLRYTDASLDDESASEVFLCLSGEEMSYRREGECSVEASYREGEDCDLCYRTPYGELLMRIHTKGLRWSFEGGKGQVSLHYQLFAQDEEVSETRLEITFALSDADG